MLPKPNSDFKLVHSKDFIIFFAHQQLVYSQHLKPHDFHYNETEIIQSGIDTLSHFSSKEQLIPAQSTIV